MPRQRVRAVPFLRKQRGPLGGLTPAIPGTLALLRIQQGHDPHGQADKREGYQHNPTQRLHAVIMRALASVDEIDKRGKQIG